MPRPITPQVHGILDHVSGLALLALPSLFGIGGTASGRILRVALPAHMASALVADHPLALRRIVPLRTHLALDAVGAAGVAVAPWVLGTAGRGARHWLPHLLFGATALTVVALSDDGGGSG